MRRNASTPGLVIAAGLVLVLFIGYLLARHPSASSPGAADTEPNGRRADEAAAPGNSAGQEAEQQQPDPRSAVHAVSAPPAQPIDPTPYARQLFPGLSNLDLSHGPVTREQAAQLKQGFQALTAQGAGALPAIRRFLEQNVDVSFGKDGAESAGVPSLRAGLLESLRQIGGPEALTASRQVLQTTADPLEIALVARELEETAPGQYRQDSLDAARLALAQAAEGKLELKDPSLLFQVLQDYGDATVVADLEKLVPQWNYYATLALAGLPSGEGIPALVRIAQDAASAETGRYKLALLMLAQVSSQYPAAGAALVDMARQGQIPDDAWRQLVAGFGNRQYQFARQLPQNTLPPGALAETGASGMGATIQTFYSAPLPPDAAAASTSQRLALIDHLLTATSNQAAVQALQQARARLSSLNGGK